MCGFAGIVTRDGSCLDNQVLRAMSYSIRHRGPDDAGYFGMTPDSQFRISRDPLDMDGTWLAMAHRRLSILDLSEEAWQPMRTADGKYWIVYNGEVYNYIELRQELEMLGYRFRSRSDTEVVLNAYIAWGTRAFTRFIGMFALVILDLPRSRLIFARDQFGIKPLYYTLNDRVLAFASEIKALLHVPGVSPVADSQAAFDYLRYAHNDHGSTTFFEAVRQVPPAHSAEIGLDRLEGIRPERYWQLDLSQENDLSYEQAGETLRGMILDSIRLHLRSDVPVGAALSGGIDSSTVVSCMRRVDPGIHLHTFSYVPDGPDSGEDKWATEVGLAAGAVLHKTRPSAEDLLTDLNHLVYVQDQPVGSTNMYAQYLVYRLAKRKGIKVVLDGQGADELLAGYGHFYLHRIQSLIRRAQFGKLVNFLVGASRVQPEFSGAGALLRATVGMLPAEMASVLKGLGGWESVPRWINRQWLRRQEVSEDTLYRDRRQSESLRAALHRSLMLESLPMLLRWQDRNSMAHSVESRVPFLTPQIAQYLLSLPDQYLISMDGTRKSVLRSAMRGIVPDSVLTRLDKVPFGSPMGAWMRQLAPWINRIVHDGILDTIPVLDAAVVKAVWADVLAGRKFNDSILWRWISLIKWVECFGVRFADA
jgi:asparagine synthase (glutamine-hydrolysing)